MLSSLDPSLRTFNRACWQSKFRHLVASHPDYTDLEAWHGQETSDIRYFDIDGSLTKLLIDEGYLEASIWEGKRLDYYIEVKTSTGPCATKFFMTPGQFGRVSQAHVCQLRTNGAQY